MITYYFVDFKGLDSSVLSRVIHLGENDIVHIMYSSANSVISFQTHFDLMKTKAKIIYRNLSYNKMFMASEIGYTIRSYVAKGCKFYLVSSNTELEALVEFWKERKIDISLVKNIPLEISLPQDNQKKTEEEKTSQENKVSNDVVNDAVDNDLYIGDLSFTVATEEDYSTLEIKRNTSKTPEEKPVGTDGSDAKISELILQDIPF